VITVGMNDGWGFFSTVKCGALLGFQAHVTHSNFRATCLSALRPSPPLSLPLTTILSLPLHHPCSTRPFPVPDSTTVLSTAARPTRCVFPSCPGPQLSDPQLPLLTSPMSSPPPNKYTSRGHLLSRTLAPYLFKYALYSFLLLFYVLPSKP
jgi:hypothetical protein